MTHIDSILVSPRSGRDRDDVRPGMMTTIYRRKTVIAYDVDESAGELVVNILGVFHAGQDWEPALRVDPAGPES